jgi:hypothetical protein
VVCDEDINPQSITSQRSSTTTIIVGGSAVGNYIPSYYIFQGKRWYGELLEGALAGSDGEMSKSGWSKSAIFKNYLTKHFIKHTGIKEGNNETPSLVLYDGHQSHVNLTLKEWPEKRNITLFVLPPHTSHLTQPLDVTMFGPLISMYNRECQTYLRNNPGINITKHKIAELTAKPYIRALCPENLISGFQKTRIYPLDKSVITDSQLAPSTIYANEDMQNKDNSESDNAQDTKEGHDSDMVVEVTQLEEPPVLHSENIEQHEKESECETLPEAEIIVARNLNTNEIHDEPLPSVTETRTTDTQTVFFEKRTITNAVKKPKHKFQPPFLARSRSKAGNIAILEKMSENAKEKAAKPCENTESTVSTNKKSRLTTNKPKPKNPCTVSKGPRPNTSGLNKDCGGPISLTSDNESDSDFLNDDGGKLCCICHKRRPDGLSNWDFITITKWGKCDSCSHWTHLIYCSNVRVIRCGDKFKCNFKQTWGQLLSI